MVQESENQDKNLQELLKENLKIAKANQEALEKIQKWIFWQRISKIIKISILAILIILGIIFFQTLLEKAIEFYQELVKVIQLNLLEQLKGHLKP